MDIAEVIIKWEMQRVKGGDEADPPPEVVDVKEEPKVPAAVTSSASTSPTVCL